MGPRLREALGVLGPWLPGYYGWLAVGAALAVVAAAGALRKASLGRRALGALAIAFPCGLLGAVVLPGAVALVQGLPFLAHGLVAYAGFAGGVAGAWVACRVLRVPFVPLAGATAPALGVGILFTRIGCFVAGCDFGAPALLPWSVQYPHDSQAFRQQLRLGLVQPFQTLSLPVHPSPLYEAALGLLIYMSWRRVKGRPALIAWGVAASYAVGRSLVELTRGDLSRGLAGGVSTSQWISAAILLGAAISWWRAAPRSSASGAVASPSR
jgi:phosphatidylglycerol:prolipoprotein diacylglycerol transferase